MKTLNNIYKNPLQIKEWIEENKLNDGNKCLVRIHPSSNDEKMFLDMAKNIKELLPFASIIGCNVSGIIFDGETYDNDTLISIIQFEHSNFTTKIQSVEGYSTEDIVNSIANYINEYNGGTGFLFFDEKIPYTSDIIDKLDKSVENTILSGGVCGFSSLEGSHSVLFDENGIYRNSYAIALIGKDYILPYSNIVTGHPAISDTFTITETDGQYIDTVENIDGTAWFNQALGITNFYENKSLEDGTATNILLRFPIVLEDYNSTTRFLQYSANGKMRVHHPNIWNGQKFKIGYVSPLRSVESWREICGELQNISVETVSCYSCLFRKVFANSIAAWEMKPFKKTGVSGAFLLGEIGTKDGQIQLLNGSCSFLTLAEKENYIKIDFSPFDDISSLSEENIDFMKEINSVHQRFGVAYNYFLSGALIEKENKLKAKLSLKSQDGIKSMNEFLHEQTEQDHSQICFISIENSNKQAISLGEEFFSKACDENIKTIVDFLQDEYKDYSFNFYGYDTSSFFFTITNKLTDKKFTELVQNLFKQCGTTKLLIENNSNKKITFVNNFTFTLKGATIQKLAEFSVDETIEVAKRRYNLCDIENSTSENIQEEFELVATLNNVIKENLVIPYFQGIYDNKKDCFFAYEALMRIQTPEGKMLFPGNFMEVAKKYNLYLPLSLCMVLKVLDIFEDRDEIITINISAYDVFSPEFQNAIFEKLRTMTKTNHFIFELVETEKFEDLEKLREFIHKVKQFGFKIAVDDFGSGYANFIEFGNLNVDYLKINGSLTQLLGTDNTYNQILESISYMGSKMKVKLIAEFVETVSMQKELIRNGVDYSQGYLFSKPMSFEELNIVSAENKEKIEQQKNNFKNDNNNSELNKKPKSLTMLHWLGILTGFLTLVMMFYFTSFVQDETKKITDEFLVEIAAGLSDKVELMVQDSRNLLLTLNEFVEVDDGEVNPDLIDNFVNAELISHFDEIYFSFDGKNAINTKGEVLEGNISEIYGRAVGNEVEIISPVKLVDSEEEIIIFATNIFDGEEKIGEIYGVYRLCNFVELLTLKSFGGEAFYHLCTIDGEPLHISGSNDNLFKDGDMYTFIESLNIYNGHTTESIKKDLLEQNTVLLNYFIQGQERSAVMIAIPNTDWCVISIVLTEVNENMLEDMNLSILLFVLGLITIFVAYFTINTILANRNRKALIAALESSYSLTNSLQTTIETDSLTRTYSRVAATEKVADAIANHNEKDGIMALAILDVDNFKEINDTHGHHTGDIYLQDFVSAVKASLRAGDILGRMGGDEFILLLRNIPNEKVVNEVFERILRNVNNISIGDVSLENVSVSIGIVTIPKYGTNFEILTQQADSALYQAKNAGKNKYMFFTEKLANNKEDNK